ncbi:hypothetical protein HG530_011448 [Fusarium avenaceum]|nr:hypothetical protein HG530_011448 [Fusarium avenaceum]
MANSVISLLPNLARQLTLPLLSLRDELNYVTECVDRLPAQLVHRSTRIVHSIHALQVRPAFVLKDLLTTWRDSLEYLFWVLVQCCKRLGIIRERRQCADDVLSELDLSRFGHCADRCSHNVFHVAAPDKDRYAGLLLDEEAEIFGSDFCGAVDVLRDGNDCLVDPCRWLAGLGTQRRAKCACCAEEDEALNLIAQLCCFLEKNEGTCDVCVDEILFGVALDMGLVKCRCMKNVTDGILLKKRSYKSAVGNRANMLRVLRREDIDAKRCETQRRKREHQGSAEMA